MRTPTSGLASALAAFAPQAGYLVRITLPRNRLVYQYCTFDRDFSFDDGSGNGTTWNAYDIAISGFNWATGPSQSGRMTLGDADGAWWTLALLLEIQDAEVLIWLAYADAANEAEPLWRGRIGAVNKGRAAVDCTLLLDSGLLFLPKRRVQDVVTARYLLPPGKTIQIGGQKWVLERKSNG